MLTIVTACATSRQSQLRVSNSDDFADLEEWYFFTPDRVRHYVKEMGDGRAVVVIHGGFGAEHSYLIPALQPLAPRYRFVLYDQRGSLRTAAADSLISLDALVADLEALRNEAGLDRLVILTHSMGAVTAYAYMKRHPNRVAGLVLTSPVLPLEHPDTLRQKAAFDEFVRFAQRNDSVEARRNGLTSDSLTGRRWTRRWRINFASGSLFHIERWPEMLGGQAFYNPRVARLVFRNSSPELLNAGLAALRSTSAPIRVILGDHDSVDFGAELWSEVVGTLPNAGIRVLPEAGHISWIDQPRLHTDALRSALADVIK